MATEFEINIQLNLDQISGKLSELENKINKATPKIKPEVDTTQANSQGVSFGKLLQSGILSGLALDVIRNTISGAFSGLGSGIKLASDFESQISSIKALGGATNEQLVQIKQTALDVGKNTK